MTRQSDQATTFTDDAFAEECSRVARQIGAILAQPVSATVDATEKVVPQIARLRDQLIVQRRAGSRTPALDDALTDINIALSLVVSVGYPEGPPQRQYLEQARDLLHAITERQKSQLDTLVTDKDLIDEIIDSDSQ